jgi:hemoglobin
MLGGGPDGPQTITVYTLAGGEETFRRLVHEFYSRVYADPLLRPMFPEDRAGAEDRLALFLMQYFGGPTTYSDRRGHPRLRLRHAPFAIGPAERDAWLGHMFAALDAAGIAGPARDHMREYFEGAANFMINRVEG